MTQLVTQAEFARMTGYAKSYITKLKQAGRLVIIDDKVDVAASQARIAATDGAARPDVSDRHAQHREGIETEGMPDDIPSDIPSKAASEAKTAHFKAMQSEADYRLRIGELVEASEVSHAVADISISFRQALENLPARIASELVGKDLDSIRATLKTEIHAALSEMERNFDKKLKEMSDD
ncbi:hypothetical protein HQN60_12575 [Deefgea piscis]|uniref:Terminase small subunit n=1 Tax=Deefgea piscis TaxID=2739061 RepID=A0A6M8SQD2_9NEIS|nr:hypothetical protein [Deefgea piscis]QKJ67472.1 hypothetical protein HQN60_12575 [Deefgea piscis]